MTFAQVNRLRSLDDILREDAADGSTIGFVRRKTVPLDDAQIKALPTTAVQLIAAPGANKAILPLQAIAVLDMAGGAYVLADVDASWALFWGDPILGPGQAYATNPSTVHAGLTGVVSALCFLMGGSPLPVVNTAGTFANTLTNGAGASAGLSDQPLFLADVWSGSATDYTGGNAANTLKVTVYYVVVDV